MARFANVDLAVAADAVAKANAGQATALAKLLPGLDKGATATETIANAQKLAAGQADLYANSTEGMAARNADALGELGETIGQAVLPILDALLPALIPIIQALGNLVTAVLPVLIPLIKLLAPPSPSWPTSWPKWRTSWRTWWRRSCAALTWCAGSWTPSRTSRPVPGPQPGRHPLRPGRGGVRPVRRGGHERGHRPRRRRSDGQCVWRVIPPGWRRPWPAPSADTPGATAPWAWPG